MASLARLDHLIGAVHRAQADHRTAEYRRQLAALAAEAVLLARIIPSDERTTAGLLGGPRRRPANRPDPTPVRPRRPIDTPDSRPAAGFGPL